MHASGQVRALARDMQALLLWHALLIVALLVPETTSAGSSAVSSSCPLGYEYAGVPHAGDDSNEDPLLYHPRFHLMPPVRKDRPTGMNDMNAMFVHEGVFHVTYQDHIDCARALQHDPHTATITVPGSCCL